MPRPGPALGPDDLIASYYTLARADRTGQARVPFADRVAAAGRAGFAGIGVQPHDHRRSVAEGTSEAAMLAHLAAAGVVLAEVDGLPWWPEAGQSDAELAEARDAVLAVAVAFDAHHLVAPMPTLDQDPSDAEVAERLGVAGERAAAVGQRVAFEFLPWTAVRTLEHAVALVRAVGLGSVGLTVDFWHLTAGGGGPESLALLRPAEVVAVHLTDGRRDPSLDPLAETMVGRRLPGDGEFDVVGLVAALDQLGATAPLGVETVSLEHRHLDVDQLAVEVHDRVRQVLAEARHR